GTAHRGSIGGIRSPWKRTFHIARREDVTTVTFWRFAESARIAARHQFYTRRQSSDRTVLKRAQRRLACLREFCRYRLASRAARSQSRLETLGPRPAHLAHFLHLQAGVVLPSRGRLCAGAGALA